LRFDDRLATVLSQPVGSSHDRVVRWRQLVDLIARSGGGGDRNLLERALDIVREDRSKVREPLRAAAARAISGAPVPFALLMLFAADKLSVSAPLLAVASLDDHDLAKLKQEASPEVRGFLNNLHQEPAETVSSDPDEPADASRPSIGDMVAKIERLRNERILVGQRTEVEDATSIAAVTKEPTIAVPGEVTQSSRLPDRPAVGEGPALFRWECNPGGEIDWVEGAPRGPLIGRSIAQSDPEEGVDDCVERAFKVRAPFRNCLFELQSSGQVGGKWVISGAPAFAPVDGRFVGYRGVARRGVPKDGEDGEFQPQSPANPHDSLREMIHEIKTPLNAIIGFAEIIDGQYFGPAHRRYRQRAAQIVTNARLLLEAAEDLDFVARSQADKADPADPARFAWVSDVAGPLADQIVARAVRRGVLFAINDDVPAGGGRRIDRSLVDKLGRRFADAMAGAAVPGEQMQASLELKRNDLILSIARPSALSLASGEKLLDPEFAIDGSQGALGLGIGFELRLLNGLAGIAGGRLEFEESQISLVFPTKEG
jgi:hypothetical protein